MIPVYRPFLGGREKEYVNRCLDSTWISSKGEFVDRFEEAFASYIGADYATSVCNGTVALHLALDSLGIGPGDEVIVPTLTYVASVNTIIQTGAKPVFVDSLPDTWQIDPDEVKRNITVRTAAVMAVHLYGQPCDMASLEKICRQHDLYLVEDCAEAFGALYQGQHVGTFGDIATFSFFGNKTITTGEGGMVVSKTAETHAKAYKKKTQGVSDTREYWHEVLAYNYRMTNICAAIGLAQLEQADSIIQRKRRLAAWYESRLQGLPLSLHQEQPGTRHSYWMIAALVDRPADRNPLRDHLGQAGIETRPLFPPVNTMPHCATNETFSVAEDLSARGFNLPSYPELSEDEVDLICADIRSYFVKSRSRGYSLPEASISA